MNFLKELQKFLLHMAKILQELEKVIDRNGAGYPATLEGCIVRLIDKVAYCGKDIEDAISAKILKPVEIPSDIKKELGNKNGKIVGTILEDIIRESHGKDYIAISKKFGDLMHKLIAFNNDNIYHCDKSERYSNQARQTLTLLFDDLLGLLKKTHRLKDFCLENNNATVHELLKEYCDEYCNNGTRIYSDDDPDELIVLDFVAGMTDSFVVRSFEELFVPKASV